MKGQNEMESQLMKLSSLAPVPLNQFFMLGYLAYGLSNQCFAQVKEPIKFILSSLTEQSITPRNALELLVIIKYKQFMKDNLTASKNIRNTIQSYVCQIICDPDYLKKQFYQPETDAIIEKNDELGAQCPICITQIDMKSLCLLGCAHMYHKQCFQAYAKENIINKRFPIICPSEECKIQVTNNEIKEFLTKQLIQKYQQFIFQNYVDKNVVDTTWCPTPGCKAVFSFDEELTNYRCPGCKKHYCLKCRCFMHTDLSCQQFQKIAHLDQPDRNFMIFVKGAKYKQCPNCKFWVQKNEGCDHMTCRCKYQFCYVCGGKYGSCQCVGDLSDQSFYSDENNQDDMIHRIRPIRPIHPIHNLPQIDIIEPLYVPPRHHPFFALESEIHHMHIGHPMSQLINDFEIPEPGQQSQSQLNSMQQKNIQIYNSHQLKKQQKPQIDEKLSDKNFNDGLKQIAISNQEPYYEKYQINESIPSQKQLQQKKKWQLWFKQSKQQAQIRPPKMNQYEQIKNIYIHKYEQKSKIGYNNKQKKQIQIKRQQQ